MDITAGIVYLLIMTEKNTEKRKLSKSIEDLAACLTSAELEFCELVFAGMEPIDAMVQSGIDIVKNAANADRIRESTVIANYIDALRRQAATRAVMSIEMIQQRLSDIAMTNATDVIDIGQSHFDMKTGIPVTEIKLKDLNMLTESQIAAISSVEPCQGGLKIKMHDKVKVMEVLAKMQGGLVDRQEVNHSGGIKTEVFAFVGDNGRGPKD